MKTKTFIMKPQTTKFKKYHKPYLKNYYNSKKKLISSQYALVTTEPTASQLEVITLAIKKALKRKLDVVAFKNFKILIGVIFIHSCLHEHLLLFSSLTYNLDVAETSQLSFQDPVSPIMQEIVNFHHYVMVYLTFLLFGVAYMLFEKLRTYNKPHNYVKKNFLMDLSLREIAKIILSVFGIIIAKMLYGEAAQCTPDLS
jgi:hypothetical protein